MRTTRLLTSVLFLLQGVASAARIVGIAEYSTSLTSASPDITFSSVGPSQSTASNTGSPTGPNFVQTTLTGTASNFDGTSFFANVALDLTAGAGTSFNSAFTEAISGVARVTNSGASSANFVASNQSLLYALQTFGPDAASLSIRATVERLNQQTQEWEGIATLSFGLGTDEANSACTPACTGGSTGGNAGYVIAPGSFADIRVHSVLRGSASQAADTSDVPEPSTIVAAASALAVIALRRLRA